MKIIRTLVVDDSALMRKKLSDILNADDEIKVIDTAKTGYEAIEKVKTLKPDVITLDIEMPDVDGLTALGYIMSEVPTPVIIVSAYALYGGKNAIKALELGAVDIVSKPSGDISLDIDKVGEDLIAKVKTAAKINISKIKEIFRKKIYRTREIKTMPHFFKKVVVIGSSTGGPNALSEILPYFPAEIPATFLIVQHMPAEFTYLMAERLNWQSKISIKEAKDGDSLYAGQALIAPGGYHMLVEKDKVTEGGGIVRINTSPPVCNVRPSANVLMDSVANIYRSNVIGVLLTGMGNDGAEGMSMIKKAGGKTIVQDKASSVVFGMPAAAIKKGIVDLIAPLSHIGIEIMKML
ncbi:MAG: chemotaxis response regulator protein-glutamate methylesterase [Candidatus Omnitrophota bacterium]